MCFECDKMRQSYHALTTHCQFKHGYPVLVRSYASGAACHACPTCCFDRWRLLRHLRAMKTPCMLLLDKHTAPLPPDVVMEVDA